MKQLVLSPTKHGEVDGIEMGILSNGSPYLTAQGLAKLCGTSASGIGEIRDDWDREKRRPRGMALVRLLESQGAHSDSLSETIRYRGADVHVFTDASCMALLEYYAFESKPAREKAVSAYRLLARQSLRQFVYERIGFSPSGQLSEEWRHYHDRLLLNDIPTGYFSVFSETGNFVLNMIRLKMKVDEHTIPDISIGMAWSAHWRAGELDSEYGARMKHPHRYPDYFPQSKGKNIEAWIYPDEAVGEFRRWLSNDYKINSYPRYIENKVAEGRILPGSAERLLGCH